MEKIDYKLLRYRIYEQYGAELDETSLIILHILNDHQEKQFDGQNTKLDEAVRSINHSQKSLQVDTQHPLRQAFWFGMGKWGFAVIFSVTTLFMYKVIRNEEIQDNGQIRKEWEWYKSYYDVSQTHKAKDLKDFLRNNPVPKDK